MYLIIHRQRIIYLLHMTVAKKRSNYVFKSKLFISQYSREQKSGCEYFFDRWRCPDFRGWDSKATKNTELGPYRLYPYPSPLLVSSFWLLSKVWKLRHNSVNLEFYELSFENIEWMIVYAILLWGYDNIATLQNIYNIRYKYFVENTITISRTQLFLGNLFICY